MPKRTRSQRKGKSKNFRSPKHRFEEKDEVKRNATGEIVDIVNDPARTAPLAKIRLDNGKEKYMIAPEGVQTGDKIVHGKDAKIKPGNKLKLENIPEGVPIHNIETKPGEGGKLVRSSGTYGVIKTKDTNKTVIRLPSGGTKDLNPGCKATVGVVGGGGRKEKPYTKAGSKARAMKAKGKQYPTTSATSMNPVDHPFGGSGDPGKPKTVKSTAPPGQKVGSFGAKSTGKKKGKRRE
ncbi:MAG: 50S ribosomal protein L2 [Candidatus Aenigmatarchaeota archaeon]